LETVLVLILVALSFSFPRFGFSWLTAAEGILARLAEHRRVAILTVIGVALGSRVILLTIIPAPEPSIHDEFSYLLAADTYAHGRLTNKTHPMWIHFESVHILQRPTYMSMYQPAQGLFLGFGEKIAGRPWIGVLISAALMSGVTCWMLQGWFPPRWALAGALLFVVRWGLFSYWVNSYWGGAVPAIGGALVVGGLPRLVRCGRVRDSLAVALGFAVLANSRPFEGLMVSATASIAFACWAYRRGFRHRILRPKAVLPFLAVLGIVGVGMLYYNWRVTGKALTLPYSADRQQYAIAPLFLWQPLSSEPAYHAASLRRVYLDEVRLYRKGRSHWGIPEVFRKLKDFWIFYVGPLLTVPLLALSRHTALNDVRTRFFLLVVGVLMAALLGEVWFYPHYAAPCMCAALALTLEGLRNLRSYRWRGKPVGLLLARVIPLGCLLLAIIPVTAARLRIPLNYWPLQWYGGTPDLVRPPSLTARFLTKHEKALIFVKYSSTHDVGDEWVYNDADIDDATVVWARMINPVEDAKLVQYFRDRTIWLLAPDEHPWVLRPYSAASEQRASS
jgi:hypothetical protein